MYKEYNNNPKNKNTSDCVVRAFSLASGKTWEDTLTDLYKLAIKYKSMPSDKYIYTKYADLLGFEKCKIELINGKKPTIESFCKIYPNGTYILRVANHLVTVKDGFYHDAWDSGCKSVYMYWKIK